MGTRRRCAGLRRLALRAGGGRGAGPIVRQGLDRSGERRWRGFAAIERHMHAMTGIAIAGSGLAMELLGI